MPALQRPGGTVHFGRAGAGPPVLLLHSLGGAGEMWATTVATLAAEHTVLTLDARGHGGSPAFGDFTVEQYADDALALLRGLDAPAHIVGISMGGQAAMQVALQAPELVRRLVLADTSLGGRGGANERVATTGARIEVIGAEAFAYEYTRSRLMRQTDEATIDLFAGLVLRTLPDVYLRQTHSIASQDLRSRAGAIAAPTLVITGSHDVSVPPPIGRQLQAAIPGAAMLIIENANHLSNLDQPEAFNRAVAGFLERYRQRATG